MHTSQHKFGVWGGNRQLKFKSDQTHLTDEKMHRVPAGLKDMAKEADIMQNTVDTYVVTTAEYERSLSVV